ncbi:MAG: hypothetical protein P1V97_18105 [Planctomycetota bacterium]|nr:hypothetical protein [Planctomycetota bacterium]
MRRFLLVAVLAIALPSVVMAGTGKKKKKRMVAPKPTQTEAAEIRTHMNNLRGRGRGKGLEKMMESLRALGDYGGKAEMALPNLQRLLGSRRANIQSSALDTIGKIAVESPKALSVLVKLATKHKKIDVRMVALDAIASVGKNADLAAPSIAKILKEKDKGLRKAAMRTLAKIGLGKAKGVDKLLRKALEEDDLDIKIEASITLISLGFKDASLVKLLDEVLADDKKIDADRQRAAEALGLFGEAAVGSVDTLARILGETITESYNPALPYGSARKVQKDKLRKACVISLGQIGPKAKAAIPALEAAQGESPLAADVRKALSLIKGQS